MLILVAISLILMLISVLGFVWGIILNARYRNPQILFNASDEDKWRWAKNASFFFTAPFALGLLAYYISIGNFDNIDVTRVNIIILVIGFSFVFSVFWSKWDLERINIRNIKRMINDPNRLNELYKFLIPGELAKYITGGFPEEGIPIIITQTLTQDEMQDQPGMIYEFLRINGFNELIFTLGFGAGEEMYIPKKITLNDLNKNIEESISQGKFKLGSDDLFIEDINKTIEFTLCHESDVHFFSKDLSLLEEVEVIWMDMNLQVRLVYEKIN